MAYPRGVPQSAESNAKRRAAMCGRTLSKHHKAKIARGMRQAWAARKAGEWGELQAERQRQIDEAKRQRDEAKRQARIATLEARIAELRSEEMSLR